MENKEYIEREKAIAYVEEQYRLFKEEEDKLAIVSGCVSSVEGVPVDEDVVRVIRCKNCAHCSKDGHSYYCGYNEQLVYENIGDADFLYPVDKDAFCSNAEPGPCCLCVHSHKLSNTTYICHRTGEIVDHVYGCEYIEVNYNDFNL